jgi:regulator of protease activity HflC (stomatin/prohibitin superfamily)
MSENILDPLLFWMWLFFILISLYSFVTAILRIGGMTPKKFVFIVFLPGLLIMTGLSIVNASLILIHLDKVGIVTSVFSEGGVRKEPIKAGRHWIVPLFEKVLVYPIGIQTYIMSSKLLEGPKIGDDSITARTEDGKEVSIDCSVTFRIDPDQVITLHKLWQDKYIDIFIRPVLRAMIRTDISQYTLEEVNSNKRKTIENQFKKHLKEAITQNGLVFEKFFLRNISFSAEYLEALKKQEAAKAAAEAEAQAIIIKAKAEAEAKRILGEE